MVLIDGHKAHVSLLNYNFEHKLRHIKKQNVKFKEKIRSHYDFFKTAMEDIKTTGSIASSSRFLVQKIVEGIPFEKLHLIVELGAGMGTITQGLLQAMRKDQNLYAYEINEDFIKHLQHIKDSRLQLLNEDASLIAERFGKNSVDVVMSSLPLKNMPLEIKSKILKSAYEALKPGGLYVQYQYSLGDFALVKSFFDETKLDFTPLNIPPAFIYFARKS